MPSIPEVKIKLGGQWYYRGNKSPSWFALASRLGGSASGIAERVPPKQWLTLNLLAERILFQSDAYCPSCGHNRDTSSVSSIDMEDGRQACQMCHATWIEVEHAQ